MEISKYSGAGAFVVTPVKAGALVTQLDQKRVGMLLIRWRRLKFVCVHYLARNRDAVLAHIKAAKFSKPMKVIEITGAQYSRRFKDAENIPGTGFRATAKQLERAFIV